MLQKTFLTGKADYLEASIERMTAQLEQAGFSLTFSSELNPVPYIYSVHVKDQDCPALFANGKGINPLAAKASALGEFIERLGTHYLFADYWLGKSDRDYMFHPQERSVSVIDFRPEDMLSPELWLFYNPLKALEPNHFVSLQEGKDLITAIPFQNLSDDSTCYFPVNILNSLYASNGMAAGNTVTEAAIQALSEIFERWVRAEIIRHQWCLPIMPKTIWEQIPSVIAIIDSLRGHGIRVEIRDASLGGCYPVVAVILHDEIEGKCFVSFGAHPIYEVALERTLTESLQGRLLSAREGFEYPSTDTHLVASEENLEAHFIDASGHWHLSFFGDQADFDAVAWNCSGDIENQWQQMQAWLNASGRTLYMHDHEILGLPVVRLVVPNMSEIYPINDLLDGNANRGLVLQKVLNAIDWQKDRSFENLLSIIEEEGYPAHTRVASLIGLLADAGTPWEALTIAELKMGCLLYLGDFTAAQDALSEVLAIGRETVNYQALGLVFSTILNEGLTDDQKEAQKAIITRLFGEERSQMIFDWCQGNCFIWDMGLADPYSSSAKHQALQRAFNRVAL